MRILGVALFFLAAQFAPAIHTLAAGDEFGPHCADGVPTAHFCECTVDHDEPPCALCTHALSSACVAPTASSAIASVPLEFSAPHDPGARRSLGFQSSASPRGPPSTPTFRV